MQEAVTITGTKTPATWYMPPLVLFVCSLALLFALEQTLYSMHILLGIGIALIFGTLTYFNFRDGHHLQGGICVGLVLIFNPAIIIHLDRDLLRPLLVAPLLLIWPLAFRGKLAALKSDLHIPTVAAYVLGTALIALCLYLHLHNDGAHRKTQQATLYQSALLQVKLETSADQAAHEIGRMPADKAQLMARIHEAMGKHIEIQADGSWRPLAPNAHPVLANFHTRGDRYRTVFLAEADLPGKNREPARRFILVAHNPSGEARQCQGCPALVGMFVFLRNPDGSETLAQYAPFIMEAGDRGKITLSRSSSAYRITDKAFMVTLTTASSYQGYVLEHTSLLGYVDDRFNKLLTFTASQTPPDDCTPEADESCAREASTFSLRNMGGVPMLKLDTALNMISVQGNVLEKTTTLYSFEDGPAPRFGSPISAGTYQKRFDRYPL